MNIDTSNAHCGPRIQFRDHAWLRVVLVPGTLLASPAALPLRGAARGRTSDRWTLARSRAVETTRVSPPGRRPKREREETGTRGEDGRADRRWGPRRPERRPDAVPPRERVRRSEREREERTRLRRERRRSAPPLPLRGLSLPLPDTLSRAPGVSLAELARARPPTASTSPSRAGARADRVSESTRERTASEDRRASSCTRRRRAVPRTPALRRHALDDVVVVVVAREYPIQL